MAAAELTFPTVRVVKVSTPQKHGGHPSGTGVILHPSSDVLPAAPHSLPYSPSHLHTTHLNTITCVPKSISEKKIYLSSMQSLQRYTGCKYAIIHWINVINVTHILPNKNQIRKDFTKVTYIVHRPNSPFFEETSFVCWACFLSSP